MIGTAPNTRRLGKIPSRPQVSLMPLLVRDTVDQALSVSDGASSGSGRRMRLNNFVALRWQMCLCLLYSSFEVIRIPSGQTMNVTKLSHQI